MKVKEKDFGSSESRGSDMRSIIIGVVLLLFGSSAFANEIYIDQVGDNLDLDITQDGSSNQFGDDTTAVDLDGDDMTFSITQTGSNNDIAAVINGNNYTGTWSSTGDYNTVDLTCDSAGLNCETVTLNITTVGDTNDFTFLVGGTSDAQNSVINFTVTGDNNITDTTIDGKSAAVTVVIDNSATLSTATATAGSITAGQGGNAVDIDISGDGDTLGHTVDLDITGGGSSYTINQSGVNDNMISADFSGDGQDVDITQSD